MGSSHLGHCDLDPWRNSHIPSRSDRSHLDNNLSNGLLDIVGRSGKHLAAEKKTIVIELPPYVQTCKVYGITQENDMNLTSLIRSKAEELIAKYDDLDTDILDRIDEGLSDKVYSQDKSTTIYQLDEDIKLQVEINMTSLEVEVAVYVCDEIAFYPDEHFTI